MLILNLVLFLIIQTKVDAATVSKTFTSNFVIFPIIIITEIKNMTSPLEHSGQTKDVIVDPNDSFAAIFNASGAPNTNFTTSIIENSINIITGDGSDATKRINVSTFTFSGLTSFDGTGNVNGIKVGATFHILSNNIPGDYSGTATLRIIYL